MNDREYNLIGENSIRIDGIITIPKGVDQDEFMDNFIKWLEENNKGMFFGFTRSIEDEFDGEQEIRNILSHSNIENKENEQ